jgi:DNA-directed RNA polymerase subunit E"
MVKKKCCKKCKRFIDGNECPVCKTSQFSTNWQGRVYVMDPARSEIGKRLGVNLKGEFALKCR